MQLSRITAVGAGAAAFFGSCCALPLLLIGVGIGGSGLAAALRPLRPWFIGLTVLLLGFSFYPIYAKKTAPCNDAALCNPKSRNITKIMLWFAVVLASIFLIGPYVIARFL